MDEYDLLKYAESKSDFSQLNIINTDEQTITFEKNNIKSNTCGNTSRFILKVWIDGKEGSSYSNVLTKELADKAVKIAKLSKKKEYFYGIPEKQKYSKIETRKLNIENEKLIEYCQLLVDSVKNSNVIASNGSITFSKERMQILNSNGIDIENKGNVFSASASAVSRDKKSNFWDAREENFVFNVGDFGKNIREKVKDFLKAQDLKPEFLKCPVIIKPEPFSRMLETAFLSNLNGSNYEKNKSLFLGKMNKKIIDNIDIIDDGAMENGINTNFSDFEGYKSQKTALIEKGYLKKLIYDFNTAKHNHTESTGNSAAGGIDFSNVIIKGPYREIDKAIVVESIMGAHTNNPLTTDFSLNVEHAYFFSKEKKIPLKVFMISGKMINVLNNIISIDKRTEQRNGIYTGAVACRGVNIVK